MFFILYTTYSGQLLNQLKLVSAGRSKKNGKRNGGGRRSKKVNGATKKNGGGGGALVTCPGFAGYCSESYPGDTCLVVCAFGRNNVPVCQVRDPPPLTLTTEAV